MLSLKKYCNDMKKILLVGVLGFGLVGVKRVLLAGVILCLSGGALAYELPTKDKLKGLVTRKADMDIRDVNCNAVLDIAELVMRARQIGVSKTAQLDQTLNYTTMPLDLVLKERRLIHKAYEFPEFNGEHEQRSVTKEFSVNEYLDCKANGL